MKNVTFQFFRHGNEQKCYIFIMRKHYRDMWDFIYESV